MLHSNLEGRYGHPSRFRELLFFTSSLLCLLTVGIQGALYSAVVTAFLIESYKWLQADASDNTVLLFSQISAQMANQSQPAAFIPFYAPTSSQITINVLWFTSLVLSLSAVLLAIMVKQWLSEYSWPADTISARQTVAMRQIRVDSLYDWHIR